jgi:segregation and condensation protein B
MELKHILEAVLFSAQKALTPKELRDIVVAATEHQAEEDRAAVKKPKPDDVSAALDQLAREHDSAGRSFCLACVAGAWQFVSKPEFAPWIKALVGHKARAPRLSQPALETLAIIAYRQPLTRAEMEQVRGVAVDGVLATLMDRGLVEQAGKSEAPGRPHTYATTPQFLEYFGLKDLEELPAADELRKIPVQKPETLLTAEPGLATLPPEPLTAVDPPPEVASSNADSPSPEGGEEAPLKQEDSSPRNVAPLSNPTKTAP